MSDLKLIALDADDLAVLSAHMQDAVLRVGDMAFLGRDRRFAMIANRFDWTTAATTEHGEEPFQRRRAGLRFERVTAAKVQGFDPKRKDQVLALLAIGFEPTSEPEGDITLMFAGGGEVRLRVECIEAEMKDLGAVWAVKSKPEHSDGGAD